jgi:cysteine synthase A
MPHTRAVDSVLDAIGHTPVVRLARIVPPMAADVFVKLESFNPTGSYKDRMALAMIAGAEARGELHPGMRVVEYTGGSTGSSLAFVCALKGYPLHLLSSDAFSEEKIRTMRAFGAEVEMIPSEGGRVTPGLFDRFKARIAVLAAEPDTFWTDQFNNRDALDGYRNIGVELVNQLGRVDLFCGAVGSGGMLVGVTQALRAAGSTARVVALEPSSSPMLTRGHGGPHRVEGTAPGFVPPMAAVVFVKLESFNPTGSYNDRMEIAMIGGAEARAIDEDEARQVARRLAREEGIFAGTSSGLNVAAALRYAAELGPGHVVATVASDSGLKYLNGDLFSSP